MAKSRICNGPNLTCTMESGKLSRAKKTISETMRMKIFLMKQFPPPQNSGGGAGRSGGHDRHGGAGGSGAFST